MTSLTSLNLSCNNLFGRIPSVGQFLAFNGSSFLGNPNLCSARNDTCSFGGHGHGGSFSTSKLIITVIALVTALLLIVVTVYRLRKKRLHNSRAWKLTAFQRLDFKAEDVLECLKEENIIGKGGAGTVYRGSMPEGRKPVGEFGDGVDIVRWVRKTTSELSQPSDSASVLAVVDPRLSGYPLAGCYSLV
ncbi:hypothetical protein OIU84_005126 [Salix udensis]|uniref:Uncharacterized protein n=1 Tax=Salix udensis TaxID=889485 RepID=A0AAD6JVC3_9ROSI|nr:hypothetical protein OIU84_005126 [Salix udensis]